MRKFFTKSGNDITGRRFMKRSSPNSYAGPRSNAADSWTASSLAEIGAPVFMSNERAPAANDDASAKLDKAERALLELFKNGIEESKRSGYWRGFSNGMLIGVLIMAVSQLVVQVLL